MRGVDGGGYPLLPKYIKCEVFEILWKVEVYKVFDFDFLHKAAVAFRLKIDLNDFFDKNLVLRFFGQI